MKKLFSFLVLFFALCITQPVFAVIYYVNAAYTGPSGNGLSWLTPFAKLDSAIAHATDGDQIWMAQGTYTAPQTSNSDGYLISYSISIYGGFTGTESSIYERDLVHTKAIISANSGLIFNIKPNKLFTVDGLNITNFGEAFSSAYNPLTSSYDLSQGDRYELTINNCNFSNGGEPITLSYYADLNITNSNFSDFSSPIVYINDQTLPFTEMSYVTVENSIIATQSVAFSLNRAYVEIYNTRLSNAEIFINNPILGGSFKGCQFLNFSDPVINVGNSSIVATFNFDSCLFQNWEASTLFYVNNLSYDMSDCIFKDGTNGGDIFSSADNIELDNVTFSNISLNYLGIACNGNLIMKNCTIDSIQQGSSSSAVFINQNSGSIVMTGTSFVNNGIPFINQLGSNDSITIANCIIQNNSLPASTRFANMIQYNGSMNISRSQFLNNIYYNSAYGTGFNASLIATLSEAVSLSVRNSIFKDNITGGQYTSVISNQVGSVVIDSCIFDANTNNTPQGTAALYVYSQNYAVQSAKISNSQFLSNSGISYPVFIAGTNVQVSNCLFEGNSSSDNTNQNTPGALYIENASSSSSSSISVSSCSFINNTAVAGPGAILNQSVQSQAVINNCIFSGNASEQNAGAIENYSGSSLQIINSLFEGNKTQSSTAGTISNFDKGVNPSLSIYNSTFVKNTSLSGPSVLAGWRPDNLANSIFWNNGTNLPIVVDVFSYSPVTYKNCDIQGGYTGTIIYDTDPKFVDFNGGNYRLSCQSPLINKGNNAYAFSYPDLDGSARIFADTIDIGAYETHVDPATNDNAIVPAFTIPVSGCRNQAISIINTTVNPSNYLFYWDFGNGIKSTLQSPSVTYIESGTYTISLLVSDYCGRSNILSKQIIINDIDAVSISGASLVCPGTTQTYISSASTCQNLQWTVSGGVIQSGQGTSSLSVLWGDGSNGNGTVTLLATGCGTGACEIPVSVTVPIVPATNNIVGKSLVCQSALENYSTQVTDQTPSTIYTWSVKGGSIYSQSSAYNLTGIQIQWDAQDTSGVIYLTTKNELLQCGATDSFKVHLRPSYTISGPSTACAGQSGAYSVSSNVGNINWFVSGSNNISYGYVSWGNQSGVYEVIAMPQIASQSCTVSDTVKVNLYASPVINSITGSLVTSSGTPVLYTAQMNGNSLPVNYNWSVGSASVLSAYNGTAVVSFASLPSTISLTAVSQSGNCSSAPLYLNIASLYTYNISGSDTVCLNSSASYSVNANPNGADTYLWTSSLNSNQESDQSVNFNFLNPGLQTIFLTITNQGITYKIQKQVYVNAAPSSLKIQGSSVIDPSGLETASYTILNTSGLQYTYQATGGTIENQSGTNFNVKWSGKSPFYITYAAQHVPGYSCPGVTDTFVVRPAQQIDSSITASASPCIGSSVTYSFNGADTYTSGITWSINGGGSFTTGVNAQSVTIVWGETGTHTITLTYERFGKHTITAGITVLLLPSPQINLGSICGNSPLSLSTSQLYASYSWYLNNATIPFSTQANPSVITEGMYIVQVTDNNGCSASSNQYINQLPFPDAKIFSYDKLSYCADATSGIQTNLNLLTFQSENYTYQWYLNNAPIAGATTYTLPVNQSLSQPAIYAYTVEVSLKTCLNVSDPVYVIVNSCKGSSSTACTDSAVSFSIDQSNVCQPFTFVNTSFSNANTGFGWSFGDGTFSNLKNPAPKTYTEAGIFPVMLTKGCASYQMNVEVPEIALFTLKSPGCAGQELFFQDLSVNIPGSQITQWVWNFGDGTPVVNGSGSGSRDQTHTFVKAGTYNVSLTVSALNTQGIVCSNTYTQAYTITGSPLVRYSLIPHACTSSEYVFIDKSITAYSRYNRTWEISNGQQYFTDILSQSFSPGPLSVHLIVTDLLGCSSSADTSFNVSAPVQIDSISYSGDTLLCNGSSKTLTAPATVSGTSYVWKKNGVVIGGNTSTLSVTSAGKYTVSYYPATGCQVTTPAVNIVNFDPGASISGIQKLCAGQSINLNSNLNSEKYYFNWSLNGKSLLSYIGSDLFVQSADTSWTGNYSLTVIQVSNQCQYTFPSYAVKVYANPTDPIISASSQSICYGGSVTLNTSLPLSGNTFSWSLNGSLLANKDSSLITVGSLTTSSTFVVTLTSDATGCSSTSGIAQILVAPSMAFTLSGDTLVCEQQSAALTSPYSGSDFNFQWYKNGLPYGGNFSKITFASIAESDSGTYQLKAISKGTTNLTGCSVLSNSKKIKVLSAPVAPVISGDSSFCEGSSLTLSTNLASNYSWNTGSTSSQIIVKTGGIYSLTSTNAVSGCTLTKSLNVVQNPLPDLSFIPSGNYTRCGSDPLNFEGLSFYPTQSWYVNGVFFSNAKEIFPYRSGKYTLQVTTDKGCTAVSDTMNIISQLCPCYVTNTNDSGDGSLRDAIICSNTKPGKDIIQFAIPGNGPFIIHPLTGLPAITDSVIIDGFSEAGYNNFSIILDGDQYNTNALTIIDNLSDVQISGLSFVNFSNAISLSSNVFNVVIDSNLFSAISTSGVEFLYGTNNNIVSNNNFNNGLAGINVKSKSYNNSILNNKISNTTNAIVLNNGAYSNLIKGNSLTSTLSDGILIIQGSTNNTVLKNSIGSSGGNGILIGLNATGNRIDSNYIGTNPTGSNLPNQLNGIYIAPGSPFNSISSNWIASNKLNGVYIGSPYTLVEKNQIGIDALNNTKPNLSYGIYSATDSISVAGNTISNNGSYGLFASNNSYIYSNVFQNNTGGGIYVNGMQNDISQNTFTNTNTSVKAIDLHASISPAGNINKQPAVFSEYRRNTNGDLIITGTSIANDSVQIFCNNDINQQAIQFAGSTVADATGKWQIDIPQGTLFDPTQRNYYVNTATNISGNTSELSQPFMIGCFTCVCVVTNVNDAGPGSLRTVINEANLGACLTINFSMTSPDTIRLVSALSPIEVPASIVGPKFSGQDPGIFIKGNNSFSGLQVNNDGVHIVNLGFDNFSQGLVLNSSYDEVVGTTFLNSPRDLTINGNYTNILSSSFNASWANTSSTPIHADTAVYITGSNNIFGGAVSGNQVVNSTIAGVLVSGGINNSILNNAIFNNTQAIQLSNNGNTNYNSPADISGSISGNAITLSGTAKPGDAVQVFLSTYYPQQALAFVSQVTADASGKWSLVLPSGSVNTSVDNYFVTTATSTSGCTSPLSSPVRVGNYIQVCYVTNTNDIGIGSLREAVNCANIAGQGTNGVGARIVFELPSSGNTITLNTPLVITNNYGVTINPYTIPVTISASNNSLNAFNWSTNNFIIKNTTFQDFAIALNCSGSNALIDSNNFVNNATGIYINAADSLVTQTVSNNYFTGGNIGLNSVRGALSIYKNTFGTSRSGAAGTINGCAISTKRANTIQLNGNTLSNIGLSSGLISPSYINGLAINIENAFLNMTGNTIQGTPLNTMPVSRFYYVNNSVITQNSFSNSNQGLLFVKCNSNSVTQNNLSSITNNGINLNNSNSILISQNTVTGLQSGSKPINLNLSSSLLSNSSKKTPSILSSTYHDGSLYLIGTSERNDAIEIFYSNKNQLDLVQYIEATIADTTGSWMASFPIQAAVSDTLYFRAVSMKQPMLSSEASNAYTPDLKTCVVINTNDNGSGSLRDAIDKANLNQCNLIQFNIPGSGQAQIQPVSELPVIYTPMLIIDGTSQPGYALGSPTVNLLSNSMHGFSAMNANQLSVYGMQITNADTAISILNSKIIDVSENVIQNFQIAGVSITTSGLEYGNISKNTIGTNTTSDNTAIYLSGTNGITIVNNKITGSFHYGLHATATDQKILSNTIIASDTSASIALYLKNASSTEIQNNTIYQAAVGIRSDGGKNLTISSNAIGTVDDTAKAHQYTVKHSGVYVSTGINTVVSNNTIIGTDTGTVFMNAINYQMSLNTISQTPLKGIYVLNSPHGEINNNTIDSCSIGMEVNASDSTTIFNNYIYGSDTYGIYLNSGSDTCQLQANIVGIRYVGDNLYSGGTGIYIKSSFNKIGGDSINGYQNYIYQNQKGGVIIDGGNKNLITYNYFYNNDKTKGRPTAYAIDLINNGNNDKAKPLIQNYKWINGKFHVYGGGASASDSIHLYRGNGGYEEAIQFLGKTVTNASGQWEVVVDTSKNKFPSQATIYLTATATDINYNTSPLSKMFIAGDCYITSVKDTADNQYPLPNTLRMAMNCANGQSYPVRILFNVNQGGGREVELQMKLQDLDNPYGITFNGRNIPDGVIAGMNGQKMDSTLWTIAAGNGKSSITNFDVLNAQNGIEIKADSISLKNIAFDQLKGTGVLVDNRKNQIDSCVFDTLQVGIHIASGIVFTTCTGNNFINTDTSVVAVSMDSLYMIQNTFSNNVLVGVYANNDTHLNVQENVFNNTKRQSNAIIWDQSSGSLLYNTFNCNDVHNPVWFQNSTNFSIKYNTFDDSSDVYLLLTNSTHGLIDTNMFVNPDSNSIKIINSDHLIISGNFVSNANWDAFNLIGSENIFISKNTVTNVAYYSNTDSALCINIHPGQNALQSNNGKPRPTNLSYAVKAGSDGRIGIFVQGLAQPGDSIQLFFSDSISASMNTYIVNAYTLADGTWEVKIPKQYYYKEDSVTWYHVIAVAIDADSNTSETSSVLHIPPSNAILYVRNVYDAGPNSLRDALLQVNASDLYCKVIFSIDYPTIRPGPYFITIDSLYTPVYSYSGFKMDGATQMQYVNVGSDQRILVNGNKIGNKYGLDIVDSSNASIMKNLWLCNTQNGLRISSDKNQINNFHFVNSDSSSQSILDTAVIIRGNNNTLDSFFVSNYTQGVLYADKASGNSLRNSFIDSTITGIIVRDSSNLNTISTTRFTNTSKYGIWFDSAGGNNNVQQNIFGEPNEPVLNNAITVTNSNSQTIVQNRVSYFSPATASLSASSVITVEGVSSDNYFSQNSIGLDSAGINVNNYNARAFCIQSTADGSPSRNSIVANVINGMQWVPVYINNSSGDIISSNLIGTDSAGHVFGFDTTGIVVMNSTNETVNDNTIAGYTQYGINLISSDQVQMHRNIVYSHATQNKGININIGNSALVSNTGIVAPAITSQTLVDQQTVQLQGTAIPNAEVEIYQSVEDTVQSVAYVNNVTASADATGSWQASVPKAFFSYATTNSYVVQNHINNNSSEFSNSFTLTPLLCQLANNPSAHILDPLYTPCPGPAFNLSGGLDTGLVYKWKASEWADTVYAQKVAIKDTAEDLTLTIQDKFGCSLVCTTNVLFKARPVSPDFIISSDVYIGDTITLVDVSQSQPTSYTWFSSPGVTVLSSGASSTIIGADGNVYPAGTRYIQFILPSAGNDSITETSIQDGCFVSLTKHLSATQKNPNAAKPYFVAPQVQSMSASPNPANANQDVTVSIVTTSTDLVTVSLYTATGGFLGEMDLSGSLSYNFVLLGNDGQLINTPLAAGLYLIKLQTDNETIVFKQVIQ